MKIVCLYLFALNLANWKTLVFYLGKLNAFVISAISS